MFLQEVGYINISKIWSVSLIADCMYSQNDMKNVLWSTNFIT